MPSRELCNDAPRAAAGRVIRLRLLVFSVTFSCGIILLGALGLYYGKTALGGMDQIYANDTQAIELLGNIRSTMLDAVVTSGSMLKAKNEQKPALLTDAEAYAHEAIASWDAYKKLPSNPQIHTLSREFERAFSVVLSETTKHYRAGYAGDIDAVAAIEAGIDPLWGAYVTATAKLVGAQKAQAKMRYENSVAFFSWFVRVVCATIMVAIGMAFFLYRNFSSTVVTPLWRRGAELRADRGGRFPGHLAGSCRQE